MTDPDRKPGTDSDDESPSAEQSSVIVLDPDDESLPVRAAVKAFAGAVEDSDRADEIREQFSIEQTPVETWEQHNETFNYDPPEIPADMWSSEQYQELHDRVIGKNTKWICEKCSQPFPTIKRARRHVQSNHGQQLLEQYAISREEYENMTGEDGADSGPSETEVRQEENHGLTDF